MSEHGMIMGIPRRWDEACFSIPALRAMERSGLLCGIVLHEEQAELFSKITSLKQIVYSDRTRAKKLAEALPNQGEASLAWEKGLLAEAFYKAGIVKRFGPEGAISKKLLTHPFSCKEGATEHRVRNYLKACELLGISTADPALFQPLDLGVTKKELSILLVPDSDEGNSYEWPLEHWKNLAKELMERGKKLSIGSFPQKKGRDLANTLRESLGEEVETLFIDPKSGGLEKLASYEICVMADSSIAHVAAISGTRCVTLFGPNDSTWKRPLGKQHQVVKRHVECAPCLSAKCAMDGRCQKELSVAHVLEGIERLKL